MGSQFWDSVSNNSREILRNFSPWNSSEFLRNTSLKIPEKFLGLDHHVYEFLGECIKRISFEKFLGISPEFHPPSKSWEFLLITSPDVLEKFLVLGHQVYWFIWELNMRINFEKFLGISLIFLKKFLRISPEYFSGNSWAILRTWSPCLRIFRGIY